MKSLNPVFKSLRRQGVLAVQEPKTRFPLTVINRMRTERPIDWRRGDTRPGFYLGAVWAFSADLNQQEPIIRYIGGGQGLKSNRFTTREMGALLEKELFAQGFEIFGHGEVDDGTEASYITLVHPLVDKLYNNC